MPDDHQTIADLRVAVARLEERQLRAIDVHQSFVEKTDANFETLREELKPVVELTTKWKGGLYVVATIGAGMGALVTAIGEKLFRIP